MGGEFFVSGPLLARAATAWDDQAEALRGARSGLGHLDTSVLGSRVQGAADTFLTTWMAQVRSHADEADGNAARLRQSATGYGLADSLSRTGLSSLLPFADGGP